MSAEKRATESELVAELARQGAEIVRLRIAVDQAEVAALRKAADAVESECSHSSEPCFCTSAQWLRDRANDLTPASPVHAHVDREVSKESTR